MNSQYKYDLTVSEFMYEDSFETIIKEYLKYILYSIVDVISFRLNLPIKFVFFFKNHIDYSLEKRWDLYLLFFKYFENFIVLCLLNFLFGFGSPFGIADYVKWTSLLIKITNFLILFLFSIVSSFFCIFFKISLFVILFTYEISKVLFSQVSKYFNNFVCYCNFFLFQLILFVSPMKKYMSDQQFKNIFRTKYYIFNYFKNDNVGIIDKQKNSWFLFAFEHREIFYTILWNNTFSRKYVHSKNITKVLNENNDEIDEKLKFGNTNMKSKNKIY